MWKLTNCQTSKYHKLVKCEQMGGKQHKIIIFLFYLVKMFNYKADPFNFQPLSSLLLKGSIF